MDLKLTASVIDARGAGHLDEPVAPTGNPGSQGPILRAGENGGGVIQTAGGGHAGREFRHRCSDLKGAKRKGGAQ